jgi:hypothetical protein
MCAALIRIPAKGAIGAAIPAKIRQRDEDFLREADPATKEAISQLRGRAHERFKLRSPIGPYQHICVFGSNPIAEGRLERLIEADPPLSNGRHDSAMIQP